MPIILCVLLLGSALTGSNLMLAFAAADTCGQYKDSADKISGSVVVHQSNNVCGLALSRDLPVIRLKGKKINDQA